MDSVTVRSRRGSRRGGGRERRRLVAGGRKVVWTRRIGWNLAEEEQPKFVAQMLRSQLLVPQNPRGLRVVRMSLRPPVVPNRVGSDDGSGGMFRRVQDPTESRRCRVLKQLGDAGVLAGLPHTDRASRQLDPENGGSWYPGMGLAPGNHCRMASAIIRLCARHWLTPGIICQ